MEDPPYRWIMRVNGDAGTAQSTRLTVLLDALDGVALADGERASLTWHAGFEAHTVKNIAAVITRPERPGRVGEDRQNEGTPAATGFVALAECKYGWPVGSRDQMAWVSSAKAAGSRCRGLRSTSSS
jgi:hypothetical protein